MHQNILKADSIQLQFHGRKILQDIFLQCHQGEVVGLLGRNGSGKSSLLKIIFGTMNADYQHVSINDQHIRNGYEENRIAYLPQQNYLPTGIMISKLARILVSETDWEEFAAHAVYDQNSHKQVTQVSGGELRQLETLMIIFSRADFILLDEPFTHLSPILADLLKPIIRSRAKTKGIIITDHQYHNILEVSDRLILLNDGSAKHIKDHEELVMYGYLNKLNPDDISR